MILIQSQLRTCEIKNQAENRQETGKKTYSFRQEEVQAQNTIFRDEIGTP